MRHAAIDDVSLTDAVFKRIQAGMDFWQHPFGDGAFFNHPLNVFAGDGREMTAL